MNVPLPADLEHSASSQQHEALNRISDWLLSGPGRPQLFLVFGYAGTGKSTLARQIAAMVDGAVVYAAYTGKAAMVMAQKGCTGAKTLHSLIYRPLLRADGSLHYVRNPDSAVANASLVIVDECSMVPDELLQDLLSFGTPVLALGDPGQLPPVDGEAFFASGDPDDMLTEIHRQALGSPVLQLATRARLGLPLAHGTYGTSRVISKPDLTEADLRDTQIIVGKNTTRKRYNADVRRLLGFAGPLPQADERLVCLSNHAPLGLCNGETFLVREIGQNHGDAMNLTLQREADAEGSAFDCTMSVRDFGRSPAFRTNKRVPLFDFAYALTCHKAQGSQWRSVLVIDESAVCRESPHRWLYTAITRAQEKVTVAS